MGIKFLVQTNIDDYFIVFAGTVLTFERDIKVKRAIDGSYSLWGTMNLYRERDYPVVPTPPYTTPIFTKELVFSIDASVLDTNLSAYLYAQMKILYPDAVDV